MTFKIKLETNNTTEEIPFNYLKETNRLGEQWDGRVLSYREDVEASSAQAPDTEVTVTDGNNTKFSGRLNDIEYNGNRAWLICDSWEQDANDAPLAKGANATGNEFEEVYSTDSETIFDDAINNVDTLSIGTVASGASNNTIDVVFSNAPHGEKIRQLELSDNFFAIYNYDKSVDYLADPGSDRTNTTLEPSSSNISGTMNVKKGGFDDGYSSILLLGAGGGGNDQISTTVTLVNNPDREKEKRVQLKDVYSKDRLDDIGTQLKDELNTDLLEVEATIRDLDVSLGDQFNVQKDEENVDNDLYVVEYERKFSGVEQYDVVLSSRRKFREDITEDVFRNIERYKTSKEPPIVFVNGGGGNRSSANSGDPFEMSQPVPVDVVYERETLLHIRGRPYRAFSSGSASGGASTGSASSFSFRQTVDIDVGSYTKIDDGALESDESWLLVSLILSSDQDMSIVDDSGEGNLKVRVVEEDTNNNFVQELQTNYFPIGTNSGADHPENSIPFIVAKDDMDSSGNNVAIEAKIEDPNDNLSGYTTFTYTTYYRTLNEHTHTPNPGLDETFPNNSQSETDDKIYPSDCTVSITDKNGTTQVATGVGPSDATDDWEEIIDITGDIDFPTESDPNADQFIEIEVEPSDLGHLEVAFGGRYALENTLQ